jgi:hypothetical protein
MLLEHLYRISLERPEWWTLWLGLPPHTSRLLDVRVELLRSYISGCQNALMLSGVDISEGRRFFDWLIDEKKEFPAKGWVTKYLDDCDGDHVRAIGKFWGFLHEYLLADMPEWFVRLNAEPLPSEIRNGLGEPKDVDIRHPEHVRAVAEFIAHRA